MPPKPTTCPHGTAPKHKCRTCASDRVSAWRVRNPTQYKHSVRNQRLKKYGLSQDDYLRLLQEQEGGCAVCTEPEPTDGSLDVDHCHTTGVVRGLLCRKCNRGVGLFNDNPELLAAASQYLNNAQVEAREIGTK